MRIERRPPFQFRVCALCYTPVMENAYQEGRRLPLDYCWVCIGPAHLAWESYELPEETRARIVCDFYIRGVAA